MSTISEILKSNANISVNVSLPDLHQFLDEIAEAKILKMEQEHQAKETDEFLTPDEACELLKISRSTLARWKKSKYLWPVKVGRLLRYSKRDIERIMKAK